MKIGDIVRLKSGSPKMTVYYIDQPSMWNGHKTMIGCEWFVEEGANSRYNPQSARFVEGTLELVE
jgi:uncharacterized protein YodC (DUF2158 family)